MTAGPGPDMVALPEDSGYLVWCQQHRLNRTVDTLSHATNLLALHLRKDHPEPTASSPTTINLTAAAAAVLRTDRGAERGGALMVWTALTGLEGEPALAYAHTVAARQTTAVIPPF